MDPGTTNKGVELNLREDLLNSGNLSKNEIILLVDLQNRLHGAGAIGTADMSFDFLQGGIGLRTMTFHMLDKDFQL